MSGLPAQANVVVIGAGIVGNSMAYQLARLGWKNIGSHQGGPSPQVVLTASQQVPCQHRELASQCHGSDLGPAASADSVEECPQRSWRPGHRPGSLDEHAPGVGTPHLGDAKPGPSWLAAGLANAGVEAEVADQALRRGEPLDVPNGGHQRQGDREVDSRHGHQAADVVAAACRPGTGGVGDHQFVAEEVEEAQVGVQGVALVGRRRAAAARHDRGCRTDRWLDSR